MLSGDGRSRDRSHRADAYNVFGGPSALLAAMRDGGELRGFAGLQDATRIRKLVPGDETTVALHRENLEHRHRRFPSVCA